MSAAIIACQLLRRSANFGALKAKRWPLVHEKIE